MGPVRLAPACVPQASRLLMTLFWRIVLRSLRAFSLASNSAVISASRVFPSPLSTPKTSMSLRSVVAIGGCKLRFGVEHGRRWLRPRAVR